MTNEELIVTIRNRVEGQFSVFLNLLNASQEYGYHKALEFVLSVLSDIEKSLPAKVSDSKELEKEAVSYCFDNGLNLSPRVATDFARHFTKWGAEHLKK